MEVGGGVLVRLAVALAKALALVAALGLGPRLGQSLVGTLNPGLGWTAAAYGTCINAAGT